MKFHYMSLCILLITVMIIPAQAQSKQQVQELYAQVTEDTPFVYFDLFGMQEGDTIYLYAESDDIDTYLIVCDIDCEDIFDENDDIDFEDGNYNSALAYEFEEDGDYSIAIADCCDEDAEGIFRLLIGFDAPDVLTGDAFPTGDNIAIPYEPTYIPVQQSDDSAQIQQFYGSVSPETEFIYYDLFDAEAGATIYIYAESDEFDTWIGICDIDCEELYADTDDIDFEAGTYNSALSYTFEEDGDYSIFVSDCCESDITGKYRILIGYNAPEILDGEGTPNGAEIAVLYEPTRQIVHNDDVVREVSQSCETLELGERPTLSGDEETIETDNFIIHYTSSGEDAATEEFVLEVGSFVETVLEVQTDTLGWPLPPQDCGEGGDTRFDFYLQEILDDGLLGFVQPENVIGDNPDSDNVEDWAAYSYLVIDNDFEGVSQPLVVMRATIAHEFHHSIQFGYDIADASSWYYEATASWMELKTSEYEDASRYASSIFDEPDLCIGTLDDNSGSRVYGEWLLIDSIAQDFGDDAIEELWEYIADYEGMDAYYNFLDNQGTTAQDVLRRYAVRVLLRDFEWGADLPGTVDVEETISGPGTYDSGSDGVEDLSMDYLLIRRRGVYTFEVDDNDLELLVVGINRNSDVEVFEIGQGGTVDTDDFDNAYLIVLNTNQHDDSDDCDELSWEIEVTDGEGERLESSNDESFNLDNFEPAG